DGEGRVHAAWYTGSQDRQGVYVAASADGGTTFGEPLPLLAGGWVPVSLVRLAALPDGAILAAWDDRRDEQHRIAVARLDGSRVRVLADDLAGQAPAVAASGGTVAVAWLDGEAVRARVAYADAR
ncbi:MAG: hypothetical protein LOD90_03725, partial [Symbiobacteriaceae bacterium]